ncbi:MAG: hypothetical protein JRE40_11035 [Deltaproteobacteria bacterium]|nr:hypothetical protein [Deltaproteobacteria bacterium]
MTLDEALELLRYQASGQIGDNAPWSAQELKLALDWSLDELAGRAARASKSRMLFEFRLDAEKDISTYTLPESIRTVKSVWHAGEKATDPLQGYTKIQHHAQALSEDHRLRAYSGWGPLYVYWLNHRTLHLKPAPSRDAAAKIVIYAYGRPMLPRVGNEEVMVPPEAERWWIAYAATMLLPPPDAASAGAIKAQLALLDNTLKGWLWRDSADIPPSPMPTGTLTG